MRPDLRELSYVGALVCFERVAAHLSFVQAASDLGVTPSAVSHRINRLEAALGKRLLERSPRRVVLTKEEANLLQSVIEALNILREGTSQVIGRSVVRLAVGPYLSANWLMPRLGRFERDNTGLRVDLIHQLGWPDMKNLDAALAWAEVPPPGASAVTLFEPLCIPVVAPGFVGPGPIWTQGIPPLHYGDRAAWRQWLLNAGGPASFADTGEIFDEPNIVLEAAAHRRGVALGFLPFITGQLTLGRLVRLEGPASWSIMRYWLVRAEQPSEQAELLCSWLAEEASCTAAEV